eukprot:6103288-Pleurochrysis_carterae.AAC.6
MITLVNYVHSPNGVYMQDASKEDTTFATVEYAHAPHPSVPGPSGTFTSRINGEYSATDARSGTKFVCHTLGRDKDKLFEVQVT